MQILNMKKVGVEGEIQEFAWEIEVSLSSVANSDAILIPDGVGNISCTVSVAGGASAKVQTSTDALDTIINGSPVWIDWDAGAVDVNTQGACEPVTAIRLAQTVAGTSKLTLRAQ